MSKPQILLIGDSIRMGYCETVKADLADTAEVVFPDDNCRCTHYVLESLAGWVGLTDKSRVAAVHFNCGHWDAAHFNNDPDSLSTTEEYARNIRRIIRILRKIYPGVPVFFATTTPMNPGETGTPKNRTTEELALYNRYGMEAAEAEGAPVDDLFALAITWDSDKFADNCHFNAEGNALLGHAVSGFLREKLGL